MAIVLADTDIRAQLHSDVRIAWTDLKAIHDEEPKLPGNATALPRAYILMPHVRVMQEGRSVLQEARYEITLQAAWPAAGTIRGEQTRRVNALLLQLTANPQYANSPWELKGVHFAEGRSEKGEPIFQVTVEFELLTTSPLNFGR